MRRTTLPRSSLCDDAEEEEDLTTTLVPNKMKERTRKSIRQWVMWSVMAFIVLFQCHIYFSSQETNGSSPAPLFRPQMEDPPPRVAPPPGKLFLNFVRVPKAGSTSMMWFLDKFSGMQNVEVPRGIGAQRKTLACLFERGSEDDDEISEDYYERNNPQECSHYNYMQSFQIRQSLFGTGNMYWGEPIQSFTLVREPFDRLRSFFGEMHRHVDVEWFKEANTPAQYAKVIEGDFISWFKLLRQESKMPPLQFHYLSYNVDEAIAMISSAHGPPQVRLFMNECYEASLRIMEKVYGFPGEGVDEFMESPYFHARSAPDAPAEAELELREKAKLWFPDEYKFYQAAEQEFQRQLWTYGIDTAKMKHECHL